MKPHIVIVGAGLVGALAAKALHDAMPSAAITLLDAAPEGARQDPRTLALALRSQQYLAQLGIWQALAQEPKHAVTPIQHIHISDATGPGSAPLHAANEGVDALGYVVQAQQVQDALDRMLQHCSTVQKRNGVEVTRVQANASGNRLELSDGSQLQANLLLVTDGSMSSTRALLGVQMRQFDYAQHALAGFIETDRPHQFTAYERFTEQGPMALLPCSGHKRFALVWCATPNEMARLKALPEVEFRHHAQHLFGNRAGYFTHSERLGTFPLHFAYAERFVGHHFAVLGNACHTLHPVAGQGYNLGIRDVIALVNTVRAHEQREIGSVMQLSAYQQARRADYQTITQFTDGLVHLFSNNIKPLSFARRCGLKALRIIPSLAKPVAQKAMGFGAGKSAEKSAESSIWR